MNLTTDEVAKMIGAYVLEIAALHKEVERLRKELGKVEATEPAKTP